MAKDVKFNIKLTVDGKAQVVQAAASTKELQAAVEGATGSTKKFTMSMVGLNQTAEVFDNAANALSNLQTALKSMAAGAASAEVANTKLATVMQQRMDASDEDVAAIKKIISAQKELGVIGGTAQVAGTQQVATFLKQRESLEVLIPAMNDLLAQQKGLNATQEDAVSVANLMGKVMTGQTSALKRVGITFDEAQENILKYGTESEKAATLAQVITDNVGHMNAELAKTDAGKQKQLENAFAGVKNKIGAIAQQALPYVSFAAQSTMLLTSTLKLANGFKAVMTTLDVFKLRIVAVNLATKLYRSTAAVAAATTSLLKSALTGAAYSATAAKIAIKGLMVSTGVGIAIAAVTTVIEALIGKMDEAKSKADSMTEAEEQGAAEAARVKGELDAETAKLKSLIDAKKDATVEVNHLNDAYGDIFGKHKTAAEWYDVLTKKSGIYAKQLAAEATMKLYAAKAGEVQMKLDENYRKREELWKSGKAQVNVRSGTTGAMMKQDAYELTALRNEGRELNADLKSFQANIAKYVAESQKYAAQLNIPTPGGGGNGGGSTTTTTHTTTTRTPKAIHTDPQAKTFGASAADMLTVGVRPILDTTELQNQLNGVDMPLVTRSVRNDNLNVRRGALQDLSQRVSTIQGDYDLGLIDVDAAKDQIDAINEMLENIGDGIEPFKLQVDTSEATDAIGSLSSVSITSFDSVKDNLSKLKDIGGGVAGGFATAGDAALMLGQSMQQLGSDSEAAKAGMIVAAVGQLALSFAQAMASTKTWIDWLAFGIAGTAQLISLVATIQGFATGGIVGGNSKTGDKMLIRANSGEMVLNNQQQANLFKLLNGKTVASPNLHNDGLAEVEFDSSQLRGALYQPGGNFEFKISGRDLVGVMANETRTSARKTNIKL